MSWIVDNANTLYVLFGLLAVAMVLIWRSNRQNKYLGYAGIAIVLIGLVWVITQFGSSDRKQLENNVHAMAQAVMEGKTDDLFKHISKDFAYHEMTRDALYAAARKAIEGHKVANISIKNFKIEALSREQKLAKTSFHASGSGGDFTFFFRVEADFVLEGDAWKLKTLRFYNPAVNQDQEIRLPGI